MYRGIDHDPVFVTDGDRLAFEGLLAEAAGDELFELHAYCPMGNHYHLLVRSTGATSAAMQRIGSSSTHLFNDRHGCDGPLFRSRFRSVPIDDDDHFVRAACYVHRNPM